MTPDDLLEQSQWDAFWVPPDARVVDRPELMYLSCARLDRPTLNCVVRTRASPSQLPALVEEVVRAHAGRRSRWLVRDRPERPALEAQLARAGYAPCTDHHVCTIDTSREVPVRTGEFTVRAVADEATLRDVLSAFAGAFGGGPPDSEEDLRRALLECTRPDARVFRVVAFDAAGHPVASGGLTHFPGLRFCLLWAGGTVPEARGRGAYQAVLAARLRRARELGATRAGLYAIVDTSAPIVLRRGFERAGSMTYWERAP